MDTMTDAEWEEYERREAEDADAAHWRRCEEYTEMVLTTPAPPVANGQGDEDNAMGKPKVTAAKLRRLEFVLKELDMLLGELPDDSKGTSLVRQGRDKLYSGYIALLIEQE
jgi:hypothetical protein